MINHQLIAETVKMVSSYYEAEGITENNTIIEAQAIDWYNHSEIVDATMLAAAVMNYGYYKAGTMWSELEHLHDFYFPNVSVDEMVSRIDGLNEADYENYEEYLAMNNYHIGEIEAAQHDAMWW
jgi:hypothetical protein